MSGRFRGPSLFTHVFVLALLEAVVVTAVHARLDAFAPAAATGVVLAVVYASAALAYAAAGRRPEA